MAGDIAAFVCTSITSREWPEMEKELSADCVSSDAWCRHRQTGVDLLAWEAQKDMLGQEGRWHSVAIFT